MEKTKNLRKIMAQHKLIPAPGAYNALTAKIAEAQGFPAVYMTGFGVSVSGYGLPDLGFITMNEMVENASRMADAVEIPLIADADTGYGNPINVVRTVRSFEKAGVSAIQIEDQQWPKRCGHMAGKKVIPTDDMVAKIRAAVDTRSHSDFLIIARTDAIAVDGFDPAIERACKYAEAGADILFVEAPENREQMSQIPKLLPVKPVLINMAPRTPNLDLDTLRLMGYALAIFPGVCLAAAISSCTVELRRILAAGKQRDFTEWSQSFDELNEWLGVPEYTAMGKRYATR